MELTAKEKDFLIILITMAKSKMKTALSDARKIHDWSFIDNLKTDIRAADLMAEVIRRGRVIIERR
jgi:hypothetical protein